MDLNELLRKVPRPLLVFLVLAASLALFVYNDPIKDECQVQGDIFDRKMVGLLYPVRINVRGEKKVQFPKINYWKDRCKEGNSEGACREYLDGLRDVVRELRLMTEKCQVQYSLRDESFAQQLSNAIQIMALVAWGEKPPQMISNRIGWMNATHLQTFCYVRRTFVAIAGEENYLALRSKVYREYPDAWPENLPIEDRLPENRPRALKTESNPTGVLSEAEVFQKSLFSLKCDLYM